MAENTNDTPLVDSATTDQEDEVNNASSPIVKKNQKRSDERRRKRYFSTILNRVEKWYKDVQAPPNLAIFYLNGDQVITEGPAHMKGFLDDPAVINRFKTVALNRPINLLPVRPGSAQPDSESASETRPDPLVLPYRKPGNYTSDILTFVIPQILKRELEGIQGKSKYIPENRPEWWPEGTRFCSPNTDKPGAKRLNVDEMRSVITAFLQKCRNKYTVSEVDTPNGDSEIEENQSMDPEEEVQIDRQTHQGQQQRDYRQGQTDHGQRQTDHIQEQTDHGQGLVEQTRTHRPKTRTDGPKTRTDGPKTRTDGPKTRTDGPKTRTGGPQTGTDGPKTRTDGPKTRTDGPQTGIDGPKTRTDGPQTGTDGHGHTDMDNDGQGPICDNDEQTDMDHDGQGRTGDNDEQTDMDHDGQGPTCDNDEQTDMDHDGQGRTGDNDEQTDLDHDGQGRTGDNDEQTDMDHDGQGRTGDNDEQTDLDHEGMGQTGDDQNSKVIIYTKEVVFGGRNDKNFLVTACEGIKLNLQSILSLRDKLSDEIIDSYMTTIFRLTNCSFQYISCGIISMMLSKNNQAAVTDFEFVSEIAIGVYNIGRRHWVLAIIDFKKKQICIIDPLGELQGTLKRIHGFWINYLRLREDTTIWNVVTMPHTKQLDSTSCGVFCLMFASRYINREDLNVDPCMVSVFRNHILETIMQNPDEHLLLKLCRVCSLEDPKGKKTRKDDTDWAGCDRCGVYWCHFECLNI